MRCDYKRPHVVTVPVFYGLVPQATMLGVTKRVLGPEWVARVVSEGCASSLIGAYHGALDAVGRFYERGAS